MRSDILRIARTTLERGLVTGTQGNVSVRADDGAVLITPTQLPYDQMDERDIVALGEPHEREPSSEWRVHTAIYDARPDVHAIVHTHSTHATAWAHREEDLAPDARTAAYADMGSAQLGTNVVEALGASDIVLLARHGVVGVGATLDDALAACERAERLARDASG